MRQAVENFELSDTAPAVNVLPEEYVRLLGYPRGWVVEGRARELSDWARGWYTENGHPWSYARQAESLVVDGNTICVDGVNFSSSRLQKMLRDAEAHSVVLAAVGAGIEAENESQQLWQAGKPDEYFFLEIFGSAVVEHLTTTIGARLCNWAEQHGMAILPHYSPGYPEWDIREQPRLLELMKKTRGERFPSHVDSFDSGMLRPKKRSSRFSASPATPRTSSGSPTLSPASVVRLDRVSIAVRRTCKRQGHRASRFRSRMRSSTRMRNTALNERHSSAGRRSGSRFARSRTAPPMQRFAMRARLAATWAGR